MGKRNRYKCAKCGYEAVVSGGFDCGVTAITRTVYCKKCTELTDIEYENLTVDDFPSIFFEPEDLAGFVAKHKHAKLKNCPSCETRDNTPWDGKKCPKCSGNMGITPDGEGEVEWE